VDTAPTPQARRIPAAIVRRLAVVAEVDPRTIERAYAGRPIRGSAGLRARRALVDAGLLPDPRTPEAA
jgi:hypothetical protein